MTTTTQTDRNVTSSLADVHVEEVMHPGFVGCALETPLTAVAHLMAEHRVHCIVGFGDVTDDDTSLWGVVSDLDLVTAFASGDVALTAGAVAATEAVTVAPDDSVLHAAQLMRDHGVAHLLVVNRSSDRPLGVLSTLDLAALVGATQLAGGGVEA
jgi:CBS domain-containing protein